MDIALDHIALNTTTGQPEWDRILDAAIQNDRRAQEIIYKKYQSKWLGVCFRYFSNRDDALEALNHSFLKIFKNMRQCKPLRNFDKWAYRIVQNTAIDYARKKMNRKDFVQTAYVEDTAFIEGDVIEKLEADDVVLLLQELPAATRVVFNLFAFEGYKHKEIAKRLGMSEGTSKWHVNNARKILKEKINRTNE